MTILAHDASKCSHPHTINRTPRHDSYLDHKCCYKKKKHESLFFFDKKAQNSFKEGKKAPKYTWQLRPYKQKRPKTHHPLTGG